MIDSNGNQILPAYKVELAKRYGVGYSTFIKWIELHPQLKDEFLKLKSQKVSVIPPSLVKLIYDLLGEP